MWLYCIKQLNREAVAAQIAGNQPITVDLGPETLYVQIRGKYGSLLRKALLMNTPGKLWFKSEAGRPMFLPLIESEHPAGIWTLEQLIRGALHAPHIQKVWTKKTKAPTIGLVIGDHHQQYCSMVYLDDHNEICIKDIETKENSRNAHVVCAYVGAKQHEQAALIAQFRALLDALTKPKRMGK